MLDFFKFGAAMYEPLYMWVMMVSCVALFMYYSASEGCNRLLARGTVVPTFLLSVMLILFIGMRPVSALFGDTVNYAIGYSQWGMSRVGMNVDVHTEWLWTVIQNVCQTMHLPVNTWFLVIAAGYIGFAFWGLKNLLWEGSWLAMMFFLSAFSTWPFGVNGLRNGVACSMMILAFSMFAKREGEKQRHVLVETATWGAKMGWAAVVAFLAMGIHRSVMLPIAACLAALYVIKKPIYAIYIWLACIPLSFLLGGAVTNFFMSLGFDERMTSYVVTANEYKDVFSGGLGFRWDFLAYSSMPVLLTWYVNKRLPVSKNPDVPDGTGVVADANSMWVFNVLATTYILCNSFWILVIRASFSNRFAYLSWFLYPVVIAYAVVRLHIWRDQDRKAAAILLGHAGFTFFMYLIGKV